ncbi:hypothetical protein DSECCO2_224890 [anaerobic digester metagenome]
MGRGKCCDFSQYASLATVNIKSRRLLLLVDCLGINLDTQKKSRITTIRLSNFWEQLFTFFE